MVKLDITMKKILKISKDQFDQDVLLSFEDVFHYLFSRLPQMHSIIYKYSDNKQRQEPILKKGKFNPVEFKIESRGGNKKLTVISNLNEFLIDAKEIQQKICTQLACSASVNNVATASASNAIDAFTITVQGNQISRISQLLKSK